MSPNSHFNAQSCWDDFTKSFYHGTSFNITPNDNDNPSVITWRYSMIGDWKCYSDKFFFWMKNDYGNIDNAIICATVL